MTAYMRSGSTSASDDQSNTSIATKVKKDVPKKMNDSAGNTLSQTIRFSLASYRLLYACSASVRGIGAGFCHGLVIKYRTAVIAMKMSVENIHSYSLNKELSSLLK